MLALAFAIPFGLLVEHGLYVSKKLQLLAFLGSLFSKNRLYLVMACSQYVANIAISIAFTLAVPQITFLRVF